MVALPFTSNAQKATELSGVLCPHERASGGENQRLVVHLPIRELERHRHGVAPRPDRDRSGFRATRRSTSLRWRGILSRHHEEEATRERTATGAPQRAARNSEGPLREERRAPRRDSLGSRPGEA